jgi:hypothetical protein
MDMSVAFTVTEMVLINRDPQNTSASGKRAADVVCELIALFNPANASTPMPIYITEIEPPRIDNGVMTVTIRALEWTPQPKATKKPNGEAVSPQRFNAVTGLREEARTPPNWVTKAPIYFG